jgi:hypothetical protein
VESIMTFAAWIAVGGAVLCLVLAAAIVGFVETKDMGLPWRRRLPF